MDPSCTPNGKATSSILSTESETNADTEGALLVSPESQGGGCNEPKNLTLAVPPPPCSGWHHLPEEILLLILIRLKDVERLRLRAVCTVSRMTEEYVEYWATRSTVHSFACTAHSLTPELMGKRFMSMI